MTLTPETHEKLFGFCKKLNNGNMDDAQDLLQDVMVRALGGKYDEQGNMAAWLTTIAKNQFINQYRKQRNKRIYQETTAHQVPTDTRNDSEYTCEVEEIWKQIAALKPKDRQAITLLIDGLQYDEIAEVQDSPIGTVKSRIHKARKELSRRLGMG